MLSGRDAESERMRSGRGICETRVRYSYVCHGKSMSDSTLIWSVGHPGDPQVIDGDEAAHAAAHRHQGNVHHRNPGRRDHGVCPRVGRHKFLGQVTAQSAAPDSGRGLPSP